MSPLSVLSRLDEAEALSCGLHYPHHVYTIPPPLPLLNFKTDGLKPHLADRLSPDASPWPYKKRRAPPYPPPHHFATIHLAFPCSKSFVRERTHRRQPHLAVVSSCEDIGEVSWSLLSIFSQITVSFSCSRWWCSLPDWYMSGQGSHSCSYAPISHCPWIASYIQIPYQENVLRQYKEAMYWAS
jgi:hypothetical protein